MARGLSDWYVKCRRSKKCEGSSLSLACRGVYVCCCRLLAVPAERLRRNSLGRKSADGSDGEKANEAGCEDWHNDLIRNIIDCSWSLQRAR